MYAVVTETDDGTVFVTVVVGSGSNGPSFVTPTHDQLDRACWLVAASIEQGSAEGDSVDKTRIHQRYDPADANQQPHYSVGDSGPDDYYEGNDDVYVVEAGQVVVR